ncbi:MAG: uracil-DNA glycosylase [Alphaproteobacteria bacterium]|nr:uracil-DNA glycosylase [Alphaproteobacteria bacterium]
MSELGDELADLVADLREWARALGDAGVDGLPPAPRALLRPASGPAPDPPPRAERRPPPARARPAPPPRPSPKPASAPASAPAPAPAPAPEPGGQVSLLSGPGAWGAFERPTAPPAGPPEPPSAAALPALTPDTFADAVGAWGFQPPPPLPVAGTDAERAARALVAIREDLGDCRRCRLCEGRNRLVFGMGDPFADLVVVGEGPGAQEDAQGLPFVGPSGEMLDNMLLHVLGLRREQVYILNVVKCRPPRNRTPEPDEIATCSPFMVRQLQAIRPKVILSMGRPATQTLLGTSRGINALRGHWQLWGDDRVPVMPTYHPAYLLRKPEDKRKTFDDLKALRERYDALGGRR